MNDALQPGGGATSDDSPEDGEEDDAFARRRRHSHEGEGGYASNSSGNDYGTGVSTLTPLELCSRFGGQIAFIRLRLECTWYVQCSKRVHLNIFFISFRASGGFGRYRGGREGDAHF